MKGIHITTLFLVLISAANTNARRFPFTLISDVHYDPNYGTPLAYGICTNSQAGSLGEKGCDAPLALIQSAFADIASTAQNSSYLLFTGDWLRHGISQEESEATFWNLTQFISGLPHVTIPAPSFSISSLGNNDFIPDYYFNVNDPPPTVAGFGNLLRDANLISDVENAAFSKAAYYTKDVSELGLRFMILNTLLYSTSLEPALDPSTTPDPAGQFAWMESQLSDAQSLGMSVVVISHVPPTMNSFMCAYGNFQPYVQGPYLTRLQAIFQQYNGTIVYMFFGHTHQLNWLADEGFGVPGLIIPSITKIFGNMASYLTAEYDDELKTFLNFRMRHLTTVGDTWMDYVDDEGRVLLDESLGPLSTLQEARATAVSLMTDLNLWNRFAIVHAGGVDLNVWPGIPADATLRLRHACSILSFSEEGYSACLDKYGPVSPTTWTSSTIPTSTAPITPTTVPSGDSVGSGIIALIVISAIVGIGVLVALLFFIRKQYYSIKEDSAAEVPLKTAQGSYLVDVNEGVN